MRTAMLYAVVWKLDAASTVEMNADVLVCTTMAAYSL